MSAQFLHVVLAFLSRGFLAFKLCPRLIIVLALGSALVKEVLFKDILTHQHQAMVGFLHLIRVELIQFFSN